MSPTSLDQNFARLVASFEVIADLNSRLRQEYTLSQVASLHGIPRAEFRRLYRIWVLESVGGES